MLTSRSNAIERARARGFTMVEMLVTMSVAAILLAIAAPAMQGMLARRAAAGSADDLASAMRLARSEAVKRGKSVSVCATDDPNATTPACGSAWIKGWLVFVDEDGDGTIDSGDKVLQVFKPNKSVSTVTEANAKAYASFVANGLAGNGALGWVLTPSGDSSSGAQRSVCLKVTGQVKVVTGSSCS